MVHRFGKYAVSRDKDLQTAQDELQRFFKYEYMIKNLVHQISREALYIYIYQRIYIITRHILWSIYKEYHLNSVYIRRDRLQQQQSDWIYLSPNYSQSIDSYRKFIPYGFEIYTGIDVYSRFIPQFYIDIYFGTAWNVFVQYINVVANKGYLLLLLSVDRNSKILLVAEVHYYLSVAIRDGLSSI